VPAGGRVQFGLKLDPLAKPRESRQTRLKQMIFEDGIFLEEMGVDRADSCDDCER